MVLTYRLFLIFLFAVTATNLTAAIAFADDASFTVTDAVNAEWYIDVDYGIPVRGAVSERSFSSHVFSPDGRNAVFLTRKGNLKTNSQCVTLHLVTLTGDGRSVNHRELLRLCSNSNNPAISNVRWLSDDRIGFIGAEADKAPQIMSVDMNDGTLTRHTAVPGDKHCFDMNADEVIVFGVIAPPKTPQQPGKVGPGYIVRKETFSDIAGIVKSSSFRPTHYYASTKHGVRQLGQTQYSVIPPFISVSPSGHFAIVAIAPRQIPSRLSELPLGPKAVSGVTTPWYYFELVLIDLKTNKRFAISGGPMAFPRNGVQVVWDERDSRVLVLDQFLATAQAANLWSVEPKNPALIEFSLNTKRITRLIDVVPTPTSSSTSETKIVHAAFDANSGTLIIQRSELIIQYQDTADGWQRTEINSDVAPLPEPAFTLAVEQNVAQPAQMFATIPETGERIAVGKINVGAKEKFNPAQVYAWTDESDRAWKAGLILPSDTTSSAPLPLIIQTHSFCLHEFVITGPRGSSAGFSGQALASAGFAVINIGVPNDGVIGTNAESKIMSEGFRSATAALAEDGIIDPERVGVIAWSRSGLWLQYALSFHDELFTAAVVSDAATFGKFNYLFKENWPAAYQKDLITQSRAVPFGEGLDLWQKRDPVTHVKAFTVPLRLNDFDEGHPLWWEAYVAMKRAGEPVEYYHLSASPHNPVQPIHQMWLQSTTIDWFRFWIMDRENPDPLDPTQYARWRKLRDEKCARLKGDNQAAVYCRR